ncbi:DUF1249 domain-containing protein [Pseudidiomarina terrestris]|uniref:DUF1249 domain-containing protein n=1 Tax=Pseudidiomarina terrestris TaxID=2820060 RepID=A0AAW7QXM0_9GAMM|nr:MULTISPECIES: DUF1249 domain-containing protein [unclassified Pseudidiomarina]MDN7123818.1 DUF1249 domain-containing protein [Pseudidiomarina sp. 1APP75-32.1]MDN7127572.1 DUF1249 domain-containing protein [Pseudidiomarina sp. 1APR75-33.1]MDN7130318.1 DUF1249 domain-containing protein [Pseudidiomarina sp. 1APR75-15]MDN7136241.1 DUF1249 domain-containing protein [Pseudidiomarina sp. 1ASP75-5]MDN7138842.1 DUF1249 domain-containing protein [Pseudidiomarina sp. 1ASP75-14]
MISDVKRKRYQFDLAALQRLAAVNYATLMKLVAHIKQGREQLIKVGSHLHFRVAVTQRAPYTTDVRIKQHALQAKLPGLIETELEVRLYHDAQLAEVTRSQNVTRLQAVYEQPNRAMHQSNEKFQVNRFLQEWLELIREQGLATEY